MQVQDPESLGPTKVQRCESSTEPRYPRKMISAILGACLLNLIAMGVMVYVAIDAQKETHVEKDGVLHVRGSTEPVRVAKVEDLGSMWDIPSESMDKLAHLSSIAVYVDKSGDIMEATFKVSSVYRKAGSKDAVFLTTPEGYTIEINGATRIATVDMLTQGRFSIAPIDLLRRSSNDDAESRRLMGVEAFLAHHHAGDVGPPPAWGGIADDGPDAPCAVAGMFGCAPMNSTYDYWKNGVPWEGPPVVFHRRLKALISSGLKWFTK